MIVREYTHFTLTSWYWSYKYEHGISFYVFLYFLLNFFLLIIIFRFCSTSVECFFRWFLHSYLITFIVVIVNEIVFFISAPHWILVCRNTADFPVSCESRNYADFYYLLPFSGCLGHSTYITKSLKTGLFTSFFTILVFVICPCWITLPRPSTTVLHGCGQNSVLAFMLILQCS